MYRGFQLVQYCGIIFSTSKDMDKIWEELRPTTCMLDPCRRPNWYKLPGIVWLDLPGTLCNASLRKRKGLVALKEATVKPFWKQNCLTLWTSPTIDLYLASRWGGAGTVPECVVLKQFQDFFSDTEFLEQRSPTFGAQDHRLSFESSRRSTLFCCHNLK